MDPIQPCQTCGAPARVRRQRVDGEATDVRVCTSASCPTNGNERSLADVV